MNSIALGLFVLAIVYVVIWSIRNDGARGIQDQSGLIRMREPAAPKAARLGPFTRSARAAAALVPTSEEPQAAAPDRADDPRR